MTADVMATLEQARADLAALRLFDLDHGPRAWTVAAGLPLYVALFGRDTLTAGWQAVDPRPRDHEPARCTCWRKCRARASTTGATSSPARCCTRRTPVRCRCSNSTRARRSYSSITTSGLYAFIVAELWHWTGDKDLVRPFIEPALRALQWLDRYGDLDGDGFYEYQTRSPMGPRNQALEGLARRDRRTRTARWSSRRSRRARSRDSSTSPSCTSRRRSGASASASSRAALSRSGRAEEALQRGVLDGGRRLLRAGARRAEAAGALDRRRIAGHCIAAAITDASLVERTADRLFATISSAAGASGRSRPNIRATTPTAITSARSGPSSTGRSRSASCATACTTASSRSRARSSKPRRCSSITACRSSSAAIRATDEHPFPGHLSERELAAGVVGVVGASRCCRRCSASIRTRR